MLDRPHQVHGQEGRVFEKPAERINPHKRTWTWLPAILFLLAVAWTLWGDRRSAAAQTCLNGGGATYDYWTQACAIKPPL